MKKVIFLFLASILSAENLSTPLLSPENHKIAFQNGIVAKVHGKTISMMDVKKKLDFFFHKNYPHLINSSAAHYQFYEQSWRAVLTEMIDHELILADSELKEVKITDGEVREQLELRFGPNTLATLDKVGLSQEEALKMIRDEMIVQRMNWWFVQSKATQKVTPEELRQAYRAYLEENPPHHDWKYRVVSIRGADALKIGQKVHALMLGKNTSPDLIAAELKALETENGAIQVSNELLVSDKDLSKAHKSALSPLSPGQLSDLISTPDNAKVCRIFYCLDSTYHPAASFDQMQATLRDQLTQNAVLEESANYLGKLRKRYDASALLESLPENLHPFTLEM
jgi:hypothetical protein